MSKPILLFLPTLLVLLASEPAGAVEHRISYTIHVDKTGLGSVQQAGVQSESATITLEENEEIVFAELSFEDELAPGTEIEIWPAVHGEIPPWALVGEDFPYPRNFWITDERTGSLVRFEVTDVVRAWQSGDLANLGFVIRIPADGEAVPDQSARAGLNSAKAVTLIYHVLPVRPPAQVKDDRPSDPRKTPRSEDGSGRE